MADLKFPTDEGEYSASLFYLTNSSKPKDTKFTIIYHVDNYQILNF